MSEQGLASAEDIDQGMVKGCAHPIGPLALADLIGLETVLGCRDPLRRAPRAAVRATTAAATLVADNLLGRKTGRAVPLLMSRLQRRSLSLNANTAEG